MLGRLLCKLGVHDTKFSGWNINPETMHIYFTWGYCTRCPYSYQLDNP